MEKAQEVFEAAVQAEEAGDSDKAIRLYEQSSLLAPQHPLPLLRAAILLFTLNKWKQAIRVGEDLNVMFVPRLSNSVAKNELTTEPT